MLALSRRDLLWVCVAAVAGLIVYSFAGLAAGVIAAVVASLVVVALASAMFGADSRK